MEEESLNLSFEQLLLSSDAEKNLSQDDVETYNPV